MQRITLLLGAILLLGAGQVSAGHFRFGFTHIGGHSSLHFSLGRAYHPFLHPPGLIHRSTHIQIYAPPPPVIIQRVPVPVREVIIQPVPQVDWNREIVEQIFPELVGEPPRRVPPPVQRMPQPKPKKKPDVKKPKKDKPDRIPKRVPDPPGNTEKDKLRYLGLKAFESQKYGLAAERFRRSLALDKKDAQSYFLLAQAYFTLGRYKLCYDNLFMGLKLNPTWATSGYRPLELYGPNVVDYSKDLLLLEEVLADHPDDPILLFVYAYHLWFDGRQVEARPIFEKLLPTFPDKGIIESFLKALPGPPVV